MHFATTDLSEARRSGSSIKWSVKPNEVNGRVLATLLRGTILGNYVYCTSKSMQSACVATAKTP